MPSEAENQHDTAPRRVQIAALLPELRGYARFLAKDRHAADDLVQDAILRALGAMEQYTPGSNLRAWMFTILRNVFYEQARRRRTERKIMESVGQAEEAHTPQGHAPQDHQQALNDVEKLLWTLSPLLREALMLIGVHGMDYEEAALICGVSVGTMKVRVSRARRLLTGATGQAAQEETL